MDKIMYSAIYSSFSPDNLSWELDEKDRMTIVIKYNGVRAFSISLYEAMESAGRKNIMKHVAECDRSPWIKSWGADDAIIEKLQGK